MFALLMKKNSEVAIIDLDGGLTMPALFVKEEQAMSVLYKNDLHSTCYVGRVRPEIYLVNDEDTRNIEPTVRDDETD